MGKHDEAEDLTQDIFLKIFKALDTFDRSASFQTWIVSISRNLCIDHYRSVRREREMIVRDNYVYPHWEGAYFFSKPAMALWMAAFGMLLFGAESNPPGEALGGLTEWGVRLPFAFVAILGIWSVYLIGKQLKDRATGVVLGERVAHVLLSHSHMDHTFGTPFVDPFYSHGSSNSARTGAG